MQQKGLLVLYIFDFVISPRCLSHFLLCIFAFCFPVFFLIPLCSASLYLFLGLPLLLNPIALEKLMFLLSRVERSEICRRKLRTIKNNSNLRRQPFCSLHYRVCYYRYIINPGCLCHFLHFYFCILFFSLLFLKPLLYVSLVYLFIFFSVCRCVVRRPNRIREVNPVVVQKEIEQIRKKLKTIKNNPSLFLRFG